MFPSILEIWLINLCLAGQDEMKLPVVFFFSTASFVICVVF